MDAPVPAPSLVLATAATSTAWHPVPRFWAPGAPEPEPRSRSSAPAGVTEPLISSALQVVLGAPRDRDDG